MGWGGGGGGDGGEGEANHFLTVTTTILRLKSGIEKFDSPSFFDTSAVTYYDYISC